MCPYMHEDSSTDAEIPHPPPISLELTAKRSSHLGAVVALELALTQTTRTTTTWKDFPCSEDLN